MPISSKQRVYEDDEAPLQDNVCRIVPNYWALTEDERIQRYRIPPAIDLSTIVWVQSGPDEDPASVLHGVIGVGGLLHLQAFAVYVDAEGCQRGVAYDEDLAAIHNAVGAEKHWRTVRISGRDYVLIASPWC